MTNPQVVGNRVWCPVCKEYVQLFRVMHAARLIDVSRQTIYRYKNDGLIHGVEVADKKYRICGSSLLKKQANAPPSSLK